MAETVGFKAIILWEHEIRAAAKAFVEAHRLVDDKSASDEERQRAFALAVRLSDCALFGAADDEVTLLLSRPNDLLGRSGSEPNAQVQRR